MPSFIRRLSLLIFAALITACATQPATLMTTPATPTAAAGSTRDIRPTAQLQKPDGVLADILRNYNETQNDCRQRYDATIRRGHYYCSGVLIRSVLPGYVPWSYSPSSIAIGATSWSWMRHDVGNTKLYWPAGIILRTKTDANRLGVPGLETGFICIYPFDGATQADNGHQGCGLRPRADQQGDFRNNNGDYTWGSCEANNITSQAQWDAYYESVGQNNAKQCSWGIENQTGWNAAIASHAKYTQWRYLWNEIMLNNYGDGSQMPKYISAVYYDVNRAGGLADAQQYQRDMNNAGYVVPLLRLDFTAASAQRFSYVAADQVVPQ